MTETERKKCPESLRELWEKVTYCIWKGSSEDYPDSEKDLVRHLWIYIRDLQVAEKQAIDRVNAIEARIDRLLSPIRRAFGELRNALNDNQ